MSILLTFGMAFTIANNAVRQNELFASWQAAQRSVKSLVVRFVLERADPVFQDQAKAQGTFRLIRTPEGKLLASYEVGPWDTDKALKERCSGLLNDGAVYVLSHDKKTAVRFEAGDHDPLPFLANHFLPFVWLLDRKRAQEECHVEVVGQDEWYTYLRLQPRRANRGIWRAGFPNARAVLTNRDSDGIPKDMPRQLWFTDGVQRYTIDISSWRMNGTDAPKPAEFAKPEDRPGWQVHEWPIGIAK
jgi:hypothetical protein